MRTWGGRFNAPPDQVLWEFTVDPSDRRLLPYDLRGSRAHVAMLGEVGILTRAEADDLDRGLKEIEGEDFQFQPSDEDVHSAVERRLIELVGPVGEKLHTGRSRNDQVALDLTLYLREAVTHRRADLAGLIEVLLAQAEAHGQTPVPSYTHLQQAQRTTLGQHLLAHCWAVSRDLGRFSDLSARLVRSPLGAGPSAGSSLPLDPTRTASLLGFEGPFFNSLDAVGSRDLATEFAYAATQSLINISRLAEEIVIWSSSEFGWITLSDAFTTGSSALPQKKNPDVAELSRGKAGAAIGHLTGLLSLQKALPLTYNRDLQEDKPPIFWLDDTLSATARALGGALSSALFHPPEASPLIDALGVAENLVRRGVPFRTAHRQVGELVLLLGGRRWEEATDEELGQVRIDRVDLEVLPNQSGMELGDQIAQLRRLTAF